MGVQARTRQADLFAPFTVCDYLYAKDRLFAEHAADSVMTAHVFNRRLDPASITADTVRLVHGRTGSTVGTARAYDAAATDDPETAAAACLALLPERLTARLMAATSGRLRPKGPRASEMTVGMHS